MNFITGTTDIDTGWDAFVSNWYAMGGQEWETELNELYHAE